MSDRLFDDMTPAQKLEHCKRCIANSYEHLQAEHGPVHLADILDVWDYWTPYLLERVTRLEAVLEAAKGLCNALTPEERKSEALFPEFDKLDDAIRLADAKDGEGEKK